MRRDIRRLFLWQVGLVGIAMIAVYLWRGQPESVLAATFGGAIALINTLLSWWRAKRASAMAPSDMKRSTVTLYAGVVERFVFTLVAFGFGMGTLQLDPPAMLVAFVIAQLSYIAVSAKAG
ncbi:ATP synthase subunit I [Halomonas sp. HP20-15]|uniref:ATP synthase subunit I n=1 Tax=Halomonas sp. HP20-15 TaxID=3085901 RepID=UPI0029810EC1|nr:ATP synthase subunit I [Halomonas sp. HP20-15]MDW5375906.1 ATP synthase subunit I [Halomonas sp. HP20-15]